jgi:hypothetical protein
MFIISQYLLYQTKMCNYDNITTYAIGSGVIIYAAIYLYLLFNNTEYLSLFNKFVIYIISIDLLLSTFLYFNTEKSHKQNFQNQFENDSESNSDDEESEFEIETEDNFDDEDKKDSSISYNTNTVEYLEMKLDNQVTEEVIEKVNDNVEETNIEETNIENENESNLDNDNLEIVESVLDKSENKDIIELVDSNIVKKKRGRKPNSLKLS